MKEEHRCVICGTKFIGFGNNPWPISDVGKCCNLCNENVVLVERTARLVSKIRER